MPTVSVILPTRDRRGLLLEAVASVLGQLHCAPEVIVVDDGSTDGTEAALRPLSGRIRYLRLAPSGVAAARNAGAQIAAGEWIAFLDSDDLWRPEKLCRQLAFHQRDAKCTVSQTDEVWIRDGVRVNPCTHHRKPQGDIFLASLKRCLVSPSAVLMRRDLFFSVGGFDETLPVCEDYDLWLRLGNRVSFGLVSEPLVVKRGGHADQLSRRYWGMDRFRVASLVKLLGSGEVTGARRSAAIDVLREKCAILAQGARRRGREEEANEYMAMVGAYDDV